jgi:hypothetical protein
VIAESRMIVRSFSRFSQPLLSCDRDGTNWALPTARRQAQARAELINVARGISSTNRRAIRPVRGGPAFSHDLLEELQVDSAANIPPSVTIWSENF